MTELICIADNLLGHTIHIIRDIINKIKLTFIEIHLFHINMYMVCQPDRDNR